MTYTTTNRTRICLALLAAFCLSAAATAARADMVSYSVTLSEVLDLIKNPNDSTAAHAAAWNTQHQLMLLRTTPYVEVKNTSQTASITQFSMTIGDLTKNFDWATSIETSPGVTVQLKTPDAVGGQVKSDVLTFNFTGFTPNSFVIFRTGLSPDDPKALQLLDYRTVLFDMNSNGGTGNNSQTTVMFSGPTGTGSLSNPLPNFPNSMPTDTTFEFGGVAMDSVVPFTTPTFSGFIQVPEPSSCILLGVGLVGFAGWQLRRHRRRTERS